MSIAVDDDMTGLGKIYTRQRVGRFPPPCSDLLGVSGRRRAPGFDLCLACLYRTETRTSLRLAHFCA